MKYTKREFEKLLKDKLTSECNVTLDTASADQIYRCLASVTRQIMSDRQKQFQSKVLGQGKKQVYYLCMEFLMGRSLKYQPVQPGPERSGRERAGGCRHQAGYHLRAGAGRRPGQRRSGPPGRLLSGRHGYRLTSPAPATPSCMSTAFSSRRSWTAGSRRLPTTGCPAAQCGWIKSHPDQAQEDPL